MEADDAEEVSVFVMVVHAEARVPAAGWKTSSAATMIVEEGGQAGEVHVAVCGLVKHRLTG